VARRAGDQVDTAFGAGQGRGNGEGGEQGKT